MWTLPLVKSKTTKFPVDRPILKDFLIIGLHIWAGSRTPENETIRDRVHGFTSTHLSMTILFLVPGTLCAV